MRLGQWGPCWSCEDPFSSKRRYSLLMRIDAIDEYRISYHSGPKKTSTAKDAYSKDCCSAASLPTHAYEVDF